MRERGGEYAQCRGITQQYHYQSEAQMTAVGQNNGAAEDIPLKQMAKTV